VLRGEQVVVEHQEVRVLADGDGALAVIDTITGFFSALSAAAYLTFKNRQSSSCGYRPPTWATFPSWTGAFPM